MSWFERMPFPAKLRFAILLTSAVAVLLACGVFLVFEYVGRQRLLVRTVTTLARSIADHSTASIAFNDTVRAQETLGSLRAEPQVVAAVLSSKEGVVIASYPEDADIPSLPPARAGVRRIGDRIVAVQPVVQGSQWLGTLYIWASQDRLNDRMQVYGLLALGVMAATFVLAWLLATALRNSIARPIHELAETAGAIAAGAHDYSLRARQYGTDELGRLTDAFNAMLDRTQAALSRLRASETQLRVVTDHASVFLTQVDRQVRYRFVNRPYADHFGARPQDLVGRSVWDVIGPQTAAQMRPKVEAVLRGERVEYELELIVAGREPRWMHAVYVPEMSTEGAVIGFVSVLTDITHRRQIEQMIARARDEALAASRAKDDFLAALSHELRTPLNPVLLISSEAATDASLPAEAREDFETIRRHVELEARLIDDLLDLTAITRGKLSLNRCCLDLHDILRDAVATVSPEIERKHIRLILNIGASRPRVLADSVRILQVFWNILKNAVKFTPEGGRVTVETSATATRVTVRITDTGIGLSPAERDRIFNAFAQGDHIVEEGHRFGGLGLGLTISRMVVELHGGDISASSEGRGKGSAFVIELPLVDREVAVSTTLDVDTSMKTTAGAACSVVTPAGARSILLVEDHAATRVALERLLTRRNYRVHLAGSVAEARAIADGTPLDLLISDVGLPDGNGYELMEEIGTRCHMRGIALTGYGMEQDLERSRRAGFCAHLTKPIRAQELDAALNRILAELP